MRFHGKIGFVKDVETEPSVFTQQVTERFYHGDTVRSIRRWDEPTEINDRLNLSNEISIVADSYILENSKYMAYVIIYGQKWKINYIELNRPRLRLTLGGVYNESE